MKMWQGLARRLRRVQPMLVLVLLAANLAAEARGTQGHTHLLVEQYGTNTAVSRSQFVGLLQDLLGASKTLEDYLKPRPAVQGLGGAASNGTGASEDSSQECYDVDRTFAELAGSAEGRLNASGLQRALAAAIFTVTNPQCTTSSNDSLAHARRHANKPSTAQAWGYGIGIVSLICVISNIGGFMGPIMDKDYFKKILIFFVALAVGALAATGILVLIPEAFAVMKIPELEGDYLWKAACVVGGLYVFYWSERAMKIGIRVRQNAKKRNASMLELDVTTALTGSSPAEKSPERNRSNGDLEHAPEHKEPIKTVAWMVMLGDGLHNFVDGLSIGAALTENLYTALSISIAILCEELPHELGDIAILLHSGLSMKRALLINFLMAITAFAGLVIGILLGESTEANRWIFAVAAGIFLYVALVDMLPEMSETAEQYAHSWRLLLPVLVLQTVGLVVGFAIILIVAHFSKMISIA